MIQYAIGMIGVTGLIILWVVIQAMWRRVFEGQFSDQDVLAERRDCGSCGCSSPCKLKKTDFKK